MISFSEHIFLLCFLGKIDVLIAGIDVSLMRSLFLTWWTLLYIARFEQEINVDDDFIEDVWTFLLYNFYKYSIHPFQGCQLYSLITMSEYYWDGLWSCCGFSFLITLVNNHFPHLNKWIIFWFYDLMCSLIWAICDDSFISLITKNNNDTYHSRLFDLFNNKSK